MGGSFITIEGPRFSTKAESHTYRSWGMSLIGMTTSPEAFLAREAELCYAPPFGSAKDPVNFAGMVPADVLRDDMPLCHWDSVDGEFLLDVRNPRELAVESVPGALNIPLPQLRARLGELPRDREVLVICRSAQRAYYATRILLQNGFKARNISGGMLSRSHLAVGWK